jgi:hypothetical protein
LVGAILLHVGVIALGLLHFSKDLKFGDAVPVTIVTSPDTQAPEIAPVPTPAEAPPIPEVTPPVPEAAPPPAPETAKPEPPKAIDPTKASAKPQKATPSPSKKPSECADFFKCAGAAIGQPKPPSRQSAKPSPIVTPAKAPKFAPTAAQASAALSGMAGKVGRLWVLDCDVFGTRDVIAKVRFTVGTDGRISEGPILVDPSQQGMLVAQAAKAAVRQAAPYSFAEVPADYRNSSITMNFSAKQACSLK